MTASMKINTLTELLTALNNIADVTTSIYPATGFLKSKVCFGIGHTNEQELIDGNLLTAVKFDNI